MKIRYGFVSNSSSSSFVVSNRANFEHVIEILEKTREDYYIFKDVLYTSPIYENDYFSELCQLSDDEREGEIGGAPYGDDDEYVEVDGVLGHDSVWLERKNMTDEDLIKFGLAPYYLSSRLYLACQRYFESDKKSEDDLYDFVNTLKQIYEGDYED